MVWGTAPTPEIAIVAGPDGRFGVALPFGTFRLQANRDGLVGTAEVEIGEAPADIVISLSSDSVEQGG